MQVQHSNRDGDVPVSGEIGGHLEDGARILRTHIGAEAAYAANELAIDEDLIHVIFALNHETKLLPRHKKIGRERDTDAVPFNSIPADVVNVILQGAAWGLSGCATWVIADVQLPSIDRQAQDAGLLGVAERDGGKQDKALQAKGLQTAGKHGARILWRTGIGIAERRGRGTFRGGWRAVGRWVSAECFGFYGRRQKSNRRCFDFAQHDKAFLGGSLAGGGF